MNILKRKLAAPGRTGKVLLSRSALALALLAVFILCTGQLAYADSHIYFITKIIQSR